MKLVSLHEKFASLLCTNVTALTDALMGFDPAILGDGLTGTGRRFDDKGAFHEASYTIAQPAFLAIHKVGPGNGLLNTETLA